MDLEIFYSSLNAEEVEVEYQVRGITSATVGVEKKFQEIIQQENQNVNLKPKMSHVKDKPEDELNLISQKTMDLDNFLDQTEDSPILEKKKLLIRIMHWRDRAQRLISSFPGLNETGVIINSLERLSRFVSRDIKRVESLSEPSKKGGRPKITSYKSLETNDNDREGKRVVTDNQPPETDIESILHRRFSKQLEDMCSQFRGELAALKKDGLEKLKTKNQTRVLGKHDESGGGSDSGSEDSSKGYQQNRNTSRSFSSRFRRRPDPTKWKLSFSGRTGKRGEENVLDFITRLEDHAYQDDIPRHELVTLMRNFVSDKADKWYYNFIRKNRHATWKQMKEELLERFSSSEGDRETRKYIRCRTQYPKETFYDFLTEIESANGRLINPLPDDEILELLLDNMNPALKSATQHLPINNIASLSKICDNLENLWNTSGFDPRRLIETRSRRPSAIAQLSEQEYFPTSLSHKLTKDKEEEKQKFNLKETSLQEISAINRQNFVVQKETTSGKLETECGLHWGTKFGKDAEPQINHGLELNEHLSLNNSLTKPSKVTNIVPTLKPHQIHRVKNYWKSLKSFKHLCVISTISEFLSNDPRPYAKIVILDKVKFGLLDSGASVSILGKGSEEFLTNLGTPIRKLNTYVQTADGTANAVTGYVKLPVTYMGKTETIKFCVVPSLETEIYLGVDFWRIFNVAPDIISEVKILTESAVNCTNNHQLSPENNSKLQEIIRSFPSFGERGLGRTHLVMHHIDVGTADPIKQRHYPVSPVKQDLIYQEIDRMITLGVIEESKSSWSSPVVLVSKANGKSRLCLDSRKINAVTKKDAYPLPFIDGLLGRLQETKYISSIDLKDAFWQIPLSESAKEITAFTVPGRPLYQFCVMPFGLCNAPQTMCRLMDRVIPHELRDRVFVYLDDLLIISAGIDEHLEILRAVARLLSNAGLTINVEKSHFVLKETRYLGFLVGERGLRTDPSKIDAITNFPAPKSVKQTRRLLGMAGWYRRFICNYAEITAPITNLLKKGVKFKWSDEAEVAFTKLKWLLTNAPVLHNPDFTKTFFIRCDASTQGIGSVLFQKDDEDNEKPIAFMSQKLNSAQRNYTVTELECLAAIVSVKKFRPYIDGYRFTIITDHASLKWLMSQKELCGRLARWSLKLQGFDFNIIHQKGRENIVPDALSRIYCDSVSEIMQDLKIHDENEFGNWKTQDTSFINLFSELQQNPQAYPNLRIMKNQIFIRIEPKANVQLTDVPCWKLWVPSEFREKLINNEHNVPNGAHGGTRKTLDRLRRLYYWPKMAVEVYQYVTNCDICKQTKATNQCLRPPLGKQTMTERPWQKIYIDLLGPYPRTATAKATATKIVEFLRDELFPLFSVPETIHSDNGAQFVGKEFAVLLNEFGINHIKTAYYSPQSNASERVNRSIVAALRAYVSKKHSTWDKFLPEIGSALRNSIHQSTNYSPHFLVFGYHKILHAKDYKILRDIDVLDENSLDWMTIPDRLAIVHSDVKSNLIKAYNKYSKQYNVRTRSRILEIGQKVFVRQHPLSDASKQFTSKFALQYRTAFVKEKLGGLYYRLIDENQKELGTFHLMDRNYWLLGDSGYPLEPWLITPYRAADEGSREAAFNTNHSRTRNIVERTIGLLKGRFRCILEARELHYNPRKASQIINVCCTLHNICCHFKVPFEMDTDSIREQELEIDPSNETENPAACEIRNNILNSIV